MSEFGEPEKCDFGILQSIGFIMQNGLSSYLHATELYLRDFYASPNCLLFFDLRYVKVENISHGRLCRNK